MIEFAGLAPAPFCGKVLRDLGARVIRIDKFGTQFVPDRLSHDKESISINLKHAKGREIVKRLATNADVLIEPFRKGVMERLGLGPDTISGINPRLIYARLTGYGQHGELSDKAGHDINYISYAGVLSTLGRRKEKPYAPVNLVADFAGGGLMCALAIVSALYQRDSNPTSASASNKVIDCSMVEGAAYVSSWLWSSRDIPGVWSDESVAQQSRGFSLLDGGHHAYDTYETKDGRFMAVGALEPAFYEQLLKGLCLNETSSEINKELLEKEFKKKTQQEWTDTFKDLDACVSPVLTLEDAPNHPHNKERNSFIVKRSAATSDDANNTQIIPNMSWLNLSDHSLNRKFQMPVLGEHTSRILKELDYTREEIERLETDRVVELFRQQKSKL